MIDKILLFPYAITLAIRDLLYRKGWKKARKAEVPTVSVGNITVGGTGKTPHATATSPSSPAATSARPRASRK